MNTQRFEVPYKDTTLIGDVVSGDSPVGAPLGQMTVLMLNGSISDRTRYSLLQDRLATVDISSASFDHIGQGETGGELQSSSLHERTNQAVAIIQSLLFAEPFGVIGSSMGAYTAVKLTELFQVNKLVLIVPGMYATDAYPLPFNAGFTERIRRHESWRETDGWEILNRFTGELLIVTAENDEVIPVEIPQMLLASAVNAKSRDLYEIPSAPHRFNAYLGQPENATLLEGYLARLEQFFDGGKHAK